MKRSVSQKPPVANVPGFTGICLVSRLALLLILILPGTEVVCQEQGIEPRPDEKVHKAFCDFYQPLVPDLRRSYTNIRFKSWISRSHESGQAATVYRGIVGKDELLYDKYPSVDSSRLDEQGDVDEVLASFATPEISHAYLTDYLIEADYPEGAPQLTIWRWDDSNIASAFSTRRQHKNNHKVLRELFAPTSSPEQRVYYPDLLHDPGFQLVVFDDDPDGRFAEKVSTKVKRLVFRKRGYWNITLETGFDAITGACRIERLVNSETGQRISEKIVEYESATDNGFLPAPRKIVLSDVPGNELELIVKGYERGVSFPGAALLSDNRTGPTLTDSSTGAMPAIQQGANKIVALTLVFGGFVLLVGGVLLLLRILIYFSQGAATR